MPAAGPGRGIWRQRVALRRRKARGVPQERRPADLDGRDEPLHPLHALRALRAGGGGRDGARHAAPRRACRDHHLRRAQRRQRAVGQHDRHLPGRRAHQQAVPLQRTHLGAVAPQEREPARFHRCQPDRAGEGRPRDARAAAGERSGQRMLDRRPRPLQLRGAQRRVAPEDADDQAGRPMAARELGFGVALRGRWPAAHQGRTRRLEHRCARLAARHAGRAAPAGQAGARPGQREHRPPVASQRLRQPRTGWACALAGFADRRAVVARAGVRDRFVPAQGPSVVRVAHPPGRAPRRQADEPARSARRLGDPGCAPDHRRAERLGPVAGRRRHRGGAGQGRERARSRRSPRRSESFRRPTAVG